MEATSTAVPSPPSVEGPGGTRFHPCGTQRATMTNRTAAQQQMRTSADGQHPAVRRASRRQRRARHRRQASTRSVSRSSPCSARGHLLIEDVPGTGKTMLARALSRSLDCTFKRIQFTPDLLPSDVTGLSIYNQKTQEFEFRAGPVVSQIVLADEINRATPKTQSALLEAMEERHVTVDGSRPCRCPSRSWSSPRRTPSSTRAPSRCRRPSSTASCCGCVWATRNRLTRCSSSTSRSARIRSTRLEPVADAAAVLEMQAAVREVYVDPAIADYIVRLVSATRSHPDVYLGASPRGSLALYRASQAFAALTGRDYVIPDDVKALAESALAHRVILKTAASIRGVESRSLIGEMLMSVPIQAPRPSCRSPRAASGVGRAGRYESGDAAQPGPPADRGAGRHCGGHDRLDRGLLLPLPGLAGDWAWPTCSRDAD